MQLKCGISCRPVVIIIIIISISIIIITAEIYLIQYWISKLLFRNVIRMRTLLKHGSNWMCHLFQHFLAISLHDSVFFFACNRGTAQYGFKATFYTSLVWRKIFDVQSEHFWAQDRLQTMTFMFVGFPVQLKYTRGTAECDWDTVLESIFSAFRFTWRVNSAITYGIFISGGKRRAVIKDNQYQH